ncbi:MAG: family metallo-hydrolase [Firmicutes bacterium]|nr:family metallo-hydrolase [Bacillota bacterium]
MRHKVSVWMLIVLSLFIAVICINILFGKDNQIGDITPTAGINLAPDQASHRLADAIKFRTISYRDPGKFDYSQFEEFHSYLKTSFPLVHQTLRLEKVNQYSLLYTWQGTDNSLKPVILAAHFDVVDIERDTLSQWQHAPFSGDISAGKIWGRGARDNKSQVMAILEAVEYMLKNGVTPKRTIILAFGHDEEVLGTNGAQKIAELLKSRNIVPECVIDEGGAVVENTIPGLKGKTALIATAEKGYLTLELSINKESCHSAEPEKQTTIGIICEAIVKLQNNPFPATLHYVEPTLSYGIANMDFPYNVVFSNLWLTGGIVEKVLLQDNASAAMLRTTIAPTIIEGGYQDNVLPASAKAIINIRLLPGESVEHAIAKVAKTIDDPNIHIKRIGFSNVAPSPSPTYSQSFIILCRTIKQIFPDTVCIPWMTTGGTDSKHYAVLTPYIYRFTPSFKEKGEISHGMDERIPIDNYMQYIEFYVNLISNF